LSFVGEPVCDGCVSQLLHVVVHLCQLSAVSQEM